MTVTKVTRSTVQLLGRLLVGPLALFAVMALATPASATTLTYQPPAGSLAEMDHHDVYMWKISGINLNGQTITGASLKFTNISNWDNTANTLFLHLFDTARYSGVNTAGDVDDSQTPVIDIADAYTYQAGQTYALAVANLISNWDTNNSGSMSSSERTALNAIGNTFLAAPGGFTTTEVNYTYNFNSAQLIALANYIANGGDIAIGLDPDCHYFTDNVILQIETSNQPKAVPEPATMTLMGVGLAGLYARRRARKA